MLEAAWYCDPKAPEMSVTSKGYEYFRCQIQERDETVYVNQLLACLDHDPHDVFHPDTFVRSHIEIPWLSVRENVYLDLAGMPFPDRDYLEEAIDPEERSVACLPQSEYERLSELVLEVGSSETSRRLRRQMREYKRQDRPDRREVI